MFEGGFARYLADTKRTKRNVKPCVKKGSRAKSVGKVGKVSHKKANRYLIGGSSETKEQLVLLLKKMASEGRLRPRTEHTCGDFATLHTASSFFNVLISPGIIPQLIDKISSKKGDLAHLLAHGLVLSAEPRDKVSDDVLGDVAESIATKGNMKPTLTNLVKYVVQQFFAKEFVVREFGSGMVEASKVANEVASFVIGPRDVVVNVFTHWHDSGNPVAAERRMALSHKDGTLTTTDIALRSGAESGFAVYVISSSKASKASKANDPRKLIHFIYVDDLSRRISTPRESPIPSVPIPRRNATPREAPISSSRTAANEIIKPTLINVSSRKTRVGVRELSPVMEGEDETPSSKVQRTPSKVQRTPSKVQRTPSSKAPRIASLHTSSKSNKTSSSSKVTLKTISRNIQDVVADFGSKMAGDAFTAAANGLLLPLAATAEAVIRPATAIASRITARTGNAQLAEAIDNLPKIITYVTTQLTLIAGRFIQDVLNGEHETVAIISPLKDSEASEDKLNAIAAFGENAELLTSRMFDPLITFFKRVDERVKKANAGGSLFCRLVPDYLKDVVTGIDDAFELMKAQIGMLVRNVVRKILPDNFTLSIEEMVRSRLNEYMHRVFLSIGESLSQVVRNMYSELAQNMANNGCRWNPGTSTSATSHYFE
jgi:hypothetical protein